ncbi:MAG TPA: MarR family transcriptional regulator [Steroidobacteraceae bacterium]|nr:MarR family transcriptional regulator [Steroidobacteraceae bacterium]
MATRHYDARTFSSAESVGYLLKLSHALMHDAAAAAFDGHDVSFTQWLVLVKVREGASTVSELCQIMWHDTGALTRLVDQLEERGYIERQRSTADRRVVQLQLTPAGRRKTTELMPLAVDRLNSALSGFSKTDFDQFMRLLKKFIASLREMQREREAAAS